MCLGGPGPGGGSAAAAASGTPASAIGPGATTGVGGSIPGGIGLGIGTGGMAGSTGVGVPGAGQGYGGVGNIPGELGPGFEGQPSGWGSSDVVNWGNLALGLLTAVFPAIAPLTAATATASSPFSFADMEIGRPIPAESAETIASQSGTGQQPSALPSISTPTEPSPVTAVQPTVDNTAFNKELMDQYMSTILTAPSGGGRGIRGAGRPGYKTQQKQTADDWLAKYWRE